MNKIPNRQVICEVLMKQAETDRELVVLCSDSRGSASLTPFTRKFPDRFVEVGIAEQDLVSISAGMAKAGKRPFAASPACFLSARSFEQIKIDFGRIIPTPPALSCSTSLRCSGMNRCAASSACPGSVSRS